MVRAAAGALAHLAGTGVADPRPPEREDVDRVRARALVEDALEGVRGVVELDTDAARASLACYGLELMPGRVVSEPEEAAAAATALGFPAVLKSTDPQLAHRADLGGVRLGIPDAERLRDAVTAMRRDLPFSDAPLLVLTDGAPRGRGRGAASRTRRWARS